MPFRSRLGKLGLNAWIALTIGAVAMGGTLAGQIIDENTRLNLNLKTVFAVGFLTVPLVWKLASMLAKMDDKLDSAATNAAEANRNVQAMQERIELLQSSVGNLWCKTHEQPCPLREPDKSA
jgi:4-amino-4-deoxy-L-arabinose transferase-like glycosyltransferase